MLKNVNLLKRRKNLTIKRKRNGRLFYFIVPALFLVSILCSVGYLFIIGKSSVFISPLAKNKFQENIKLEQLLSKTNITFTKTTSYSDSSILVVLKDKEEVIFSSKKDLGSQIASLQLITKRLTIEGKRFKRLDFRYDKPMIIL